MTITMIILMSSAMVVLTFVVRLLLVRKRTAMLSIVAAVLTICGTSVMTSCFSNEDNPVVSPTPQEQKLDGVWYTAYEASGTIANPYGEGTVSFTHIVETYKFRDDGINLWNRYFFDEESDEPLADLAGGSGGLGQFTYTSQGDGLFTFVLNNTSNAQEANRNDYLPLTRELRLVDDKLLGKGLGNQNIEFVRDTIQADALFDEWNILLHGGWGASTNSVDLNADLENVEYTILHDEVAGLGATLKAVLSSPQKSSLVEAAVAELKGKEEPSATRSATTRATGAVTAMPTGYRSIDYLYTSVDEKGQPVKLSARMVWGGFKFFKWFREMRPDYILLAPHYTISDDFQCPTSGRSIEDLMMAGDKLLILPDYLGFGHTKDRVQPYIIHDLCAQNSIDALKAGYKIFRDMAKVPLMDDFTLSVAGVSQGGGNALAIHKWLDTHPDFAKRWRFDFSYCAAGPYSPRITFEKYFEQKKLTYPVVMPVVIKALRTAYPDILGKWTEDAFFSESYLKQKAVIDKMVDSKEYTSDEINDYIFKMYPHTGEKDITGGQEIWLSDVVSPEIMNLESDICKALFECLDKNDLTKGWTPIHPIHLYHGKNDDIVSYANAQAVMAAFPDKADLKSPTNLDGHIGTSVQWLMSIMSNSWREIY